jgi:hypothetical protein
MVNVVCMKWGTKYPPAYVNKLRSMVGRHLSRGHRFVCFTDDVSGLEGGMETQPLPNLDLPAGPERGWRKLTIFTTPLADLQGPTLFLDLDVVVLSSLDCFFEHPGEFCIIHDWAKPWRPTGNSSVFRFEANAHPDILDTFITDIESVRRAVRNEQEYLTREMARRGKLTYWPKPWCVSFKHGCLPAFPLNLLQRPRIPAAARIIVFHGNPKPEDALHGGGRGWLRHTRPTPWIRDHWR